MIIKVILPAGDIPLRSTVTKVTGEKLYTLVDQLTVYGIVSGSSAQTIIKPEPGVRYMVGDDGTVVAVPSTKEIMWRANSDELSRFLCDAEDGGDSG
jgi:hypothetical protein